MLNKLKGLFSLAKRCWMLVILKVRPPAGDVTSHERRLKTGFTIGEL